MTFLETGSELFAKLKRNTGLKQSLLMVFGNAAGQGFSALALILITRSLGPTQFGQFSVGFALLLILVRLNDLGLTTVLQKFGAQATTHDEANKLFSYTFKLKLIVAGGIALTGSIASPWIAQLLNFDQPLIVALAFILSSATVVYEQLQAMLQSLHRFTQSVVANTIQAFAKFAGAIILFAATASGFHGKPADASTTLWAFSWYMAAPALPLLFIKKLAPSWLSLKFSQNFIAQKSLVRSLATHSAIGFIAAGIIENIDVLFVQHYLNSYETGLLAGVSRIALLFNLMAYSLGTVLNPRVAKYQESSHLGKYLKKAWLIVGASVLGFLAFLPFSKFAIQLTIGPEYLGGEGVLVLLMAAAFLTVAVMPFIALFFSFNYPWYFSISGLVQLGIIIAGNSIFVPLYGLEAAAWTRVIARLVLFVGTVGFGLWGYWQMQKRERG
jgi:O-antigen/teichoic acid export membrane protein